MKKLLRATVLTLVTAGILSATVPSKKAISPQASPIPACPGCDPIPR